jgi:C4-dicarboxylate-specific signal transduction histidine kinase
MAFDPHQPHLQSTTQTNTSANVAGLILSIIGFSLLSIAWAGSYAESKRIGILGLIFTLLGLILFWRSLQALVNRKIMIVPEIVPLAPTSAREWQSQLLELESRIEHAPIALFNLYDMGGNKQVTPLNGNARRLIAPGRSSNVQQLYTQLKEQVAGQRSTILFETEQGLERALLASNTVLINGQHQVMIALMPVESELQLEAQNAWLKLIHVLTHEIMNSLTPVTSLSNTAQELLIENQYALQALDYQDLSIALDAISRRASGLVEFVSGYRSLSNVPAAKPERVQLATLLARLHALSIPAWSQRGGKINFCCEPDNLTVIIDPNQLEQALINLIKNAAEATANNNAPELTIHAKLSRGARMRLEISDNGPGVPEELISQVFTPFFSTKEHGSGIGLALVRQLIQGNGGTVRYAQRLQGGAQFIITI